MFYHLYKVKLDTKELLVLLGLFHHALTAKQVVTTVFIFFPLLCLGAVCFYYTFSSPAYMFLKFFDKIWKDMSLANMVTDFPSTLQSAL